MNSQKKYRTVIPWDRKLEGESVLPLSPSSLRAKSMEMKRKGSLLQADIKGRTALHRAVSDGSIESCEVLLDLGFPVNVQDNEGVTPLALAATSGFGPLVRYLLHRGAQPEVVDNRGLTALYRAVLFKHHDCLKWIIQMGGKVDIQWEKSRRPIHCASRHGDFEILQLLLKSGADPTAKDNDGFSSLHYACVSGSLPCVRELVAHGVRVNERNRVGLTPLHMAVMDGNAALAEIITSALDKQDLNAQDEDGNTALMWAVEHGKEQVLSLLISLKSETNICNRMGQNAFMMSCKYGNLEIFKAISKVTIGREDKDQDGQNGLHIACSFDHDQIADHILSKKLVSYQKDKYGQYPLHIAAKCNSWKCLRVLYSHSVCMTEKDEKGHTALWWACRNGCLESVKVLLEMPHHLEDVDESRQTPLMTAALHGNKEIVKVLLQNGAIAVHRDNMGRTVLHLACAQGFHDVIQDIVRKGGNVNETTKSGMTPLSFALRQGHADVVSILIQLGAKVAAEESGIQGSFEEMPWNSTSNKSLGAGGKNMQDQKLFSPYRLFQFEDSSISEDCYIELCKDKVKYKNSSKRTFHKRNYHSGMRIIFPMDNFNFILDGIAPRSLYLKARCIEDVKIFSHSLSMILQTKGCLSRDSILKMNKSGSSLSSENRPSLNKQQLNQEKSITSSSVASDGRDDSLQKHSKRYELFNQIIGEMDDEAYLKYLSESKSVQMKPNIGNTEGGLHQVGTKIEQKIKKDIAHRRGKGKLIEEFSISKPKEQNILDRKLDQSQVRRNLVEMRAKRMEKLAVSKALSQDEKNLEKEVHEGTSTCSGAPPPPPPPPPMQSDSNSKNGSIKMRIPDEVQEIFGKSYMGTRPTDTNEYVNTKGKKYRGVMWIKISKANAQGSFWVSSQQPTWKHEICLERLEDLFRLPEGLGKDLGIQVSRTVESGIIDPRKAMNIGILLSGVTCTTEDLISMLSKLVLQEETGVSVEFLQGLLKALPSAEELLEISKTTTEMNQLSSVEDFVQKMSCEFGIRTKIEVAIHISTLENRVESLLQDAETICLAMEEILSSESLRSILLIFLKYGNWLNCGTSRSNAAGFSIQSLSKFFDAKSVDQSTSVGKYIAAEIWAELPELAEKLQQELPTVSFAHSIPLDGVYAEFNAIWADYASINKLSGSENEIMWKDETFKAALQAFCHRISPTLQSLQQCFHGETSNVCSRG
eukprot:TRINITY_DN3911_c0_g1_i3.p1 TRINITY_DN3911_c0_g1~~TRINITY_DN3911_c0_g1_i3.p1  ORF type:complete len:1210 (+),score=194.55 TRINITY_DN3911_c0_g1_i3:84-3713(+)